MIRDGMRGVNAFAVQSCRRNLVTNYSKVLMTNLTQTRFYFCLCFFVLFLFFILTTAHFRVASWVFFSAERSCPRAEQLGLKHTIKY